MKSVYTGGEKVAEFESYDELRVGENKPAFIYEGSELVYPSPVKDGLVLWYDFSGRTNADGQRGIAEDLSGNGNHGTLQNFNYTPESGYDKNKLLFDGVDDYIDTFQIDNPEEFTVTVNLNGINHSPNSQIIIKDYMSGSRRGWSIRKEATSYRILIWREGVSGYLNIYAPLDEGIFNSISLIYTPYEIAIYTGGKLSYTLENSNKLIADNFEPILIGGNQGVFGKVIIKSVSIYNRALTPSEIAHNYAIEKERFGIE